MNQSLIRKDNKGHGVKSVSKLGLKENSGPKNQMVSGNNRTNVTKTKIIKKRDKKLRLYIHILKVKSEI